MHSEILFKEKHWKPPFLIVIVLLIALSRVAHTQQAGDEEELQDDFKILIEQSPYELRFTLNDTEKYEIVNVTCRSVKAFEDTDAENQTCENLEPCTSYRATVHVQDLSDETQIFERQVDTETAYTEPKVKITEVRPSIETILLSWAANDSSCVSKFEIEVKAGEKVSKWNKFNTETEQLIEGLSPCEEHSIQLVTIDVNNDQISNLTTSNKTEYADPGNIVNVTLVEYDNAQMKVSWELEEPKYKTCISYYLLKWYLEGCIDEDTTTASPTTAIIDSNTSMDESGRDESVPPGIIGNSSKLADAECIWYATLADFNAKDHIIGNLQGCENYLFEIYINTEINPKNEKQPFTAPEQKPGPVKSGDHEVNAVNITLHWSPPVTNRKCVDYYKILATGPLEKPEHLDIFDEKTGNNFFTLDGLQPCGRYNYTITPISLNGVAGESESANFDTKEAQPSPIQNLTVQRESNALVISWDPPEFADMCLTGYSVAGRDDDNELVSDFDKQTKNTSVRVENLNSCRSYTVQVIPSTQNTNGLPVSIETETAPLKSEAPTTLQAINKYPHSLELSAQVNNNKNDCENIFARFRCTSTKDDTPHRSAEQYVEGIVGDRSFKALLSPLSPFAEYRCQVSIFNVAGWGEIKTSLLKTEPYFPEPPQQVVLKTRTNVSLTISWQRPMYPNGAITLYTWHFQLVEAGYYIPPQCSALNKDPKSSETSQTEWSFSNLHPYTIYSIQVAAQNDYGIGEYTRPYIVITDPAVSETVRNLMVVIQGPYESATEYKANVVVSWAAPCRSNGVIYSYELEFRGKRNESEDEYFNRSVDPEHNENGGLIYNETMLKPEYSYSVAVTVVVTSRDGHLLPSPKASKEFAAPAGIPKQLNQTTISLSRVDAQAAENPTKSAVVRFPAQIMESELGRIQFVALLLSEKNCHPPPELRYAALNSQQEWPTSPTWNEVYEERGTACIDQYQTTPIRWEPKPYTENGNEFISFTIGTEKCQGDKSNIGSYCNGPLRPDTDYHLVVRLFTKSGYNDAAMLEFKTEALIPLTIIIISVSSCFLFVLVAGLIYLVVTKRINWKRESLNGIEDSLGNVCGKNFAIFYHEVSKPEKIAREFKELTLVAMDLSYASSELGCYKNRYADIFPYDKNRVILDIDADGSDYINASFIDGYRKKKEYIATQGPKTESVMDFWRMILQHNVRLIVMVTQFREDDVIKCHEYFPYQSKAITVTVKRKDEFELYDRTELMVTHDNYGLKQKVVHLYFKKWPDHGVPTDPMHLIEFVRKVKAERIPNFSPIVVHCSAGVGRTGTFIGLDIIMQRLRTESKINIYETVKKLRFQRMKMVQSLAQYTFLYTCTYELVKHKNTKGAIAYQKKKNKRVSFEDEVEEIDERGPGLPNHRYSLNNMQGIGDGNGLKPLDSIAMRQHNFIRNGSDLESLAEQPDTEAAFAVESTESAT